MSKNECACKTEIPLPNRLRRFLDNNSGNAVIAVYKPLTEKKRTVEAQETCHCCLDSAFLLCMNLADKVSATKS